jgi:hypothetical protein
VQDFGLYIKTMNLHHQLMSQSDHPPIGLKDAINDDMELVWQVFISQFQVNENCVTYFIAFFIIGFFYY